MQKESTNKISVLTDHLAQAHPHFLEYLCVFIRAARHLQVVRKTPQDTSPAQNIRIKPQFQKSFCLHCQIECLKNPGRKLSTHQTIILLDPQVGGDVDHAGIKYTCFSLKGCSQILSPQRFVVPGDIALPECNGRGRWVFNIWLKKKVKYKKKTIVVTEECFQPRN